LPNANPGKPKPPTKYRDCFDYLAGFGVFLTFIAAASDAVFTGIAAWTAKDTEERQLRAYLYIFPVTLTVFTPDKPFGFLLSITNNGQTPMREGYVKFGFDVMPSDNENEYTVGENKMIIQKPHISLGKDNPSPLRLASKEKATGDQFVNFRDNGWVVVLKGDF
jgi:hypothetical protein